MTTRSSDGGGGRTLLRAARVHRWTLWQTPGRPLGFILCIELLAVIVLAASNAVDHATGVEVARFVGLTALAALYSEATDRIERFRRYLAASVGTAGNASSLWCFTAALVLEPGFAAAFTALLYAHTLVRAHRHQAGHPYRLIYTGSTEVLATFGAAIVITHVDPSGHLSGSGAVGLGAVLAAILTYAVINQSLVSTVVYLVGRPARVRDAMLNAEDMVLEFATLGLATLTAVTMLHAPLLTPMSVLLLVVLRRSALVRQLQAQASHDPKTGLLNSAAWRQCAERELSRAAHAQRPVAVLMIDLDHFKNINDNYGHPTGDAALTAVAGCLADALRGRDSLGRYGGEEFVAFLDDVDAEAAQLVASRLADRIRRLELPKGAHVTASIGIGHTASARGQLDSLIAAADAALYIAKDAGRDQTAMLAPSSAS